jgi:hypothetical protein
LKNILGECQGKKQWESLQMGKCANSSLAFKIFF